MDAIIILPSKSYSYGIEFDFDTSILTYEYKYHFHLLNQMYGTEFDFDTCILFLMLIRIVRPDPPSRLWKIFYYFFSETTPFFKNFL